MTVLFKRIYSDESIGQDVYSDLDNMFSEHAYASLPEEEDSFFKKGSFIVTVEWEDDE
jgi:hypothetical protein